MGQWVQANSDQAGALEADVQDTRVLDSQDAYDVVMAAERKAMDLLFKGMTASQRRAVEKIREEADESVKGVRSSSERKPQQEP